MSRLKERQNARRQAEPRFDQLSQDMSKITLQQQPKKYTLKREYQEMEDNSELEVEVQDDTLDNDNYNTEGTYDTEELEKDQSELHMMTNPMNFTKTKLDLSVRHLEEYFHINEFDPTLFDELSEVPVSDRVYIAAFLFYYHYKNEINRFLDRYPLSNNASNNDIYLERYINFLIEKQYFKLNFTNASILLNDHSSNNLFVRIMLIFKALQNDNPLKNMKYTPPKPTQEEFHTLKKPMQLNYYNTVSQKTMRELLDMINNYNDIEFVTPFENSECNGPIELSFMSRRELFVEENLVKKLPNILRNIMKIKYNTNRFTLDHLENLIKEYPIITGFIKQFNMCLRDYNTFTSPKKQLTTSHSKNRSMQVNKTNSNLFIPKRI